MRYVAYTDGAYRRNIERGGYAAYMVDTGDLIYGGSENSTNNRMELMAVVALLDHLPDGISITVYSDSAYVVNAIKCGWIHNWARKNWMTKKQGHVKNLDLWLRVYAHLPRIDLEMRWVKGHSGNPYNELCDEISSYMTKK